MKKKLFLIGLVMLIAFAAFSEEIEMDKSVGLKDSDVKNFIKNCKNIYKDAEKFTGFVEATATTMPGTAAAAVLSGLSSEKAFTDILNKNGISGANAIEKFARIHFYTTVAAFDKTMEQALAENPALAAYMAAATVDPYADMRKKLNAAEFNIIKANIDGLMQALELINKDNNDE